MIENQSSQYKDAHGRTSCHMCKTSDRFSRVLISGAGFLADAYDLFVINLSVDLMSRCTYNVELTSALKSRVKSMALLGAVVGQLGFGSIADLIGRKWVFIMTCTIVIFGSLLSATVLDSTGSFNIYSQLTLWRFVLGVGVGGEYPLSAAVTTESSDPGQEIRNLAMVFSMQGLGTLLCAVVLVKLTQTLGDRYEIQWRLALLFGAFPMMVAFYFRWKMHETRWNSEEQTLAVEQNQPEREGGDTAGLTISALTNESDIELVRGIVTARRLRRSSNYWKLLGTAGSWFILDVIFYGNGLFSGQVTEVMNFAHDPRSEALASLFLQSIALPGYLCTILFAEQIGLQRLQLGGFAATALFFLILAALQPFLVQVPVLYAFLYGMTFFAQNFGANSTTYIIPSLLFPVEHRATCHGISAAAGKLGALLGAQVFLDVVGAFCAGGTCTDDAPARQVSAGLQLTFAACGILSILGFAWTYWLVEEPTLSNHPTATHGTNYNTLPTAANDRENSLEHATDGDIGGNTSADRHPTHRTQNSANYAHYIHYALHPGVHTRTTSGNATNHILPSAPPSAQLEYESDSNHSSFPTQYNVRMGGFDVRADVNRVVHNPLLYSDSQSI
eukprot:gene11121-12958_t